MFLQGRGSFLYCTIPPEGSRADFGAALPVICSPGAGGRSLNGAEESPRHKNAESWSTKDGERKYERLLTSLLKAGTFTRNL